MGALGLPIQREEQWWYGETGSGKSDSQEARSTAGPQPRANTFWDCRGLGASLPPTLFAFRSFQSGIQGIGRFKSFPEREARPYQNPLHSPDEAEPFVNPRGCGLTTLIGWFAI